LFLDHAWAIGTPNADRPSWPYTNICRPPGPSDKKHPKKRQKEENTPPTMVRSPLLRLLCGLCSSAVVSAAPAFIWSSSSSSVGGISSSIYTSDEIAAASLFDHSANLQVVFLLGRGSDGSESLTRMAPFLSGIAQKSPAHIIHSHVSGVESVHAMKRTAAASANNASASATHTQSKVVVIGLHELGMKFNDPIPPSSTTKTTTKKSREIGAANILLIDVDATTSPDAVDSAVQTAMAHADRVVLTAVRSIAEVKDERAKITRRRMEMQFQAGQQQRHLVVDGRRHRRLENNNQNNQQQAVAANDQMAGIYFVQMTPNIFAGILFFFLFATISFTGISCMGMIAAQDIYVKKMPPVGREA
jgi:hypothetical protein